MVPVEDGNRDERMFEEFDEIGVSEEEIELLWFIGGNLFEERVSIVEGSDADEVVVDGLGNCHGVVFGEKTGVVGLGVLRHRKL